LDGKYLVLIKSIPICYIKSNFAHFSFVTIFLLPT
jgi:hypothetical protein